MYFKCSQFKINSQFHDALRWIIEIVCCNLFQKQEHISIVSCVLMRVTRLQEIASPRDRILAIQID